MMRKEEVLGFIRQNDFASTQQLCERFQVSESTIRRMLDKLDAAGLITRVHGGAMPIATTTRLTEYQVQSRENKEEKIAIAKAAAELIHDHDTVILMGGTTVFEMCPFIENRCITVITNSIPVFNGLRYSHKIRLIMLSGLYNIQEEEVGGLLDNTGLDRMRANWMFMGASGFDERFGFALSNAPNDIYSQCMNSSLNVCVMADSSKYMRGGTTVAATPDQVEVLITDKGLNPKAKKALEELGTRVILVDSKQNGGKCYE